MKTCHVSTVLVKSLDQIPISFCKKLVPTTKAKKSHYGDSVEVEMNIGRFSTNTVLILQCTVTKKERVRACSMHRGVMNLEYRCLGKKVGT